MNTRNDSQAQLRYRLLAEEDALVKAEEAANRVRLERVGNERARGEDLASAEAAAKIEAKFKDSIVSTIF